MKTKMLWVAGGALGVVLVIGVAVGVMVGTLLLTGSKAPLTILQHPPGKVIVQDHGYGNKVITFVAPAQTYYEVTCRGTGTVSVLTLTVPCRRSEQAAVANNLPSPGTQVIRISTTSPQAEWAFLAVVTKQQQVGQ